MMIKILILTLFCITLHDNFLASSSSKAQPDSGAGAGSSKHISTSAALSDDSLLLEKIRNRTAEKLMKTPFNMHSASKKLTDIDRLSTFELETQIAMDIEPRLIKDMLERLYKLGYNEETIIEKMTNYVSTQVILIHQKANDDEILEFEQRFEGKKGKKNLKQAMHIFNTLNQALAKKISEKSLESVEQYIKPDYTNLPRKNIINELITVLQKEFIDDYIKRHKESFYTDFTQYCKTETPETALSLLTDQIINEDRPDIFTTTCKILEDLFITEQAPKTQLGKRKALKKAASSSTSAAIASVASSSTPSTNPIAAVDTQTAQALQKQIEQERQEFALKVAEEHRLAEEIIENEAKLQEQIARQNQRLAEQSAEKSEEHRRRNAKQTLADQLRQARIAKTSNQL